MDLEHHARALAGEAGLTLRPAAAGYDLTPWDAGDVKPINVRLQNPRLQRIRIFLPATDNDSAAHLQGELGALLSAQTYLVDFDHVISEGGLAVSGTYVMPRRFGQGLLGPQDLTIGVLDMLPAMVGIYRQQAYAFSKSD